MCARRMWSSSWDLITWSIELQCVWWSLGTIFIKLARTACQKSITRLSPDFLLLTANWSRLIMCLLHHIDIVLPLKTGHFTEWAKTCLNKSLWIFTFNFHSSPRFDKNIQKHKLSEFTAINDQKTFSCFLCRVFCLSQI